MKCEHLLLGPAVPDSGSAFKWARVCIAITIDEVAACSVLYVPTNLVWNDVKPLADFSHVR